MTIRQWAFRIRRLGVDTCHMVVESKTKPVDLFCEVCQEPAEFLSPTGALCPTDALIDAAFNGWIPAAIRTGAHLKRRDLDEGNTR